MISEKRYTIYFSLRLDAAKALKKVAYEKDITISELVRKTLEKSGLIPVEKKREIKI
jgi:hypothetical protein